MRRADRAVEGLENILAILDKCDVMRIGLSVENKPYIVPMNFAYEVADETVLIYFHCALQGKKMDMISLNRNVCFEVDALHGISKGDVACGWSVGYESVMGEGEATVITDERQKVRALDVLMKRHGYSGRPYYSPDALSAVSVLRISVTAMTGKRKSME